MFEGDAKKHEAAIDDNDTGGASPRIRVTKQDRRLFNEAVEFLRSGGTVERGHELMDEAAKRVKRPFEMPKRPIFAPPGAGPRTTAAGGPSPEQLKAAEVAGNKRAQTILTILDTFVIRGRGPVGDIAVGELDAIVAHGVEAGRDGRLADLIRQHVPPHASTLDHVRTYVDANKMTALIAQATAG